MSYRRCLWTGLLVLAVLFAAGPARAQPLVITLRAPDGADDLRNQYARDAVELALDKTRASDGPYRLQVSAPMTKPRAMLEAAGRRQPNFLIVAGPQSGREAGLVPVRFPIHLGANRFRVCFVHAPRQAAVRAAGTRAEVARLRHVQGQGWPDVAVLRANGFRVSEVNAYASMFELVALGRADLFCRNVLEVGQEARVHAGMPGLALDDSLLLSYDLPQYLYTHPANTVAIDRIERGLRQAFADGSLQALLRRHLQPSLAMLKLQQRRLITLDTPRAAWVEMDDRPYQIDLLRGPGR